MEVVVIAHKGGQRSDGSVSIQGTEMQNLHWVPCAGVFPFLMYPIWNQYSYVLELFCLNQSTLTKEAEKLSLIHVKTIVTCSQHILVSGHIAMND